MPWPSFTSGRGGDKAAERAARQAADERAAAWEKALARDAMPAFVTERLQAAGAGRAPWTSTMTAAELLLARTHGMTPIAMVSGTCWYQYGFSWTRGHADGWRAALERMREEAVACGANAVVDVKMRTIRSDTRTSMDFTLIGTAIRVKALPPSAEPILATAPALEFVRLLEAGIVPVGLAVGAEYQWLTDYNKSFAGGAWNWNNQPLGTLSSFWEDIRRTAHRDLKAHARHQGNGVLAHVQFGQLLKAEGDDKQPDRYLGRHIVIGTVVQCRPGDPVPHAITPVVDMRDELSPLNGGGGQTQDIYSFNEREGAI